MLCTCNCSSPTNLKAFMPLLSLRNMPRTTFYLSGSLSLISGALIWLAGAAMAEGLPGSNVIQDQVSSNMKNDVASKAGNVAGKAGDAADKAGNVAGKAKSAVKSEANGAGGNPAGKTLLRSGCIVQACIKCTLQEWNGQCTDQVWSVALQQKTLNKSAQSMFGSGLHLRECTAGRIISWQLRLAAHAGSSAAKDFEQECSVTRVLLFRVSVNVLGVACICISAQQIAS